MLEIKISDEQYNRVLTSLIMCKESCSNAREDYIQQIAIDIQSNAVVVKPNEIKLSINKETILPLLLHLVEHVCVDVDMTSKTDYASYLYNEQDAVSDKAS